MRPLRVRHVEARREDAEEDIPDREGEPGPRGDVQQLHRDEVHVLPEVPGEAELADALLRRRRAVQDLTVNTDDLKLHRAHRSTLEYTLRTPDTKASSFCSLLVRVSTRGSNTFDAAHELHYY